MDNSHFWSLKPTILKSINNCKMTFYKFNNIKKTQRPVSTIRRRSQLFNPVLINTPKKILPNKSLPNLAIRPTIIVKVKILPNPNSKLSLIRITIIRKSTQ